MAANVGQQGWWGRQTTMAARSMIKQGSLTFLTLALIATSTTGVAIRNLEGLTLRGECHEAQAHQGQAPLLQLPVDNCSDQGIHLPSGSLGSLHCATCAATI